MPERTFDQRRMARLDSPERRKLLPRENILPLLDVETHHSILDVGAGAGYFTFPLAQQTTHTVYALDIEQDMLSYIKKQMDIQEIENIKLIHGKIENMPLEDNHVHRIIASMVLHEVRPLLKALEEIYRVLHPGGRFVCIDWMTDKNDPRPNRIHSSAMKKAAEKVGFQHCSLTFPSQSVYALTFKKA